jgi:hypothetical protein
MKLPAATCSRYGSNGRSRGGKGVVSVRPSRHCCEGSVCHCIWSPHKPSMSKGSRLPSFDRIVIYWQQQPIPGHARASCSGVKWHERTHSTLLGQRENEEGKNINALGRVKEQATHCREQNRQKTAPCSTGFKDCRSPGAHWQIFPPKQLNVVLTSSWA